MKVKTMNDDIKNQFDKARYAEFNIEDKEEEKKFPSWYKDLDEEESYVYDYLMEMVDEYTECIKAYPDKTKDYLAEMMTEFMELLEYINKDIG